MGTGDQREFGDSDALLAALHRSQAVIEFDLDGVILAVNQNYCEMMGYAADEIIGRRHEIFCEPSYVATAAYRDFWRRLSSGDMKAGVFRRLAKDGREVWIQATYTPAPGSDGKPAKVIKIATDVTESKRRETELDAANTEARRFAALREATNDWFWEIDPDGRITYLSENFSRFASQDRESEIGKSRSELVIRYADEEEARRIEGLIAERKPFRDLTYLRNTGDGRQIWVRVSGAPRYASDGDFLGYHGAGTEITAQMVTQERRNQLASLLDRIPIGLLLIDRNLDISLANKYMLVELERYCENVGVGSNFGEIVRQAVRSRYVPISPTETEKYLEQRIAAIRSGPTQIEQTRGDRTVEIRSTPLGDSVLFFEIDATDRRELRDQLIHAQRLEAVGHLTAGIAHDFNNLLAIILGNLELLREDVEDGAGADFVESALAATERGAALTKHLLAFGRRASLSPKVIDIDETIRSIGDLLRRTLPERITLDLRFGEGKKAVEVDPGQLEQAILNLVINARDAIDGGGGITISTALSAKGPATFHQDFAPVLPSEFVVISIADDGQGIASEELDKVIEPFFTTKEVGKGSGLGLSMVHGFVSQSGGDVVIDSAVGRGTTVSLYFPSIEPRESPVQDDADAAHPGAPSTARILLVEDDGEVRRVTRAQLEALGCRVTEASDGAGALRELASEREFDLMLTDNVMPGPVQGRQLLAEARRLRAGLRIIMMTGYADSDAAKIDSEDVEILLKPVSRGTLRAAIERAVTASDDQRGR